MTILSLIEENSQVVKNRFDGKFITAVGNFLPVSSNLRFEFVTLGVIYLVSFRSAPNMCGEKSAGVFLRVFF